MKLSFLFLVLLSFMLLIGLKLYKNSELLQLKCVISSVDGNEYCVRDRNQVNEAADLLAKTTNKCSRLVQYMQSKRPNNPITKRLVENYNPDTVRETLPTSSHTAYSENKGEKLAFCLTKSKNGDQNKLIEQNTLLFVALHELSHVATVSIGHTPEYWSNFKFILENAVEMGIYDPIDYKKNPTGYCGMTISDSPYYDY
jgi:hypothetical protein